MAEIASGSIDLKSLKVAGEPNKYITYINSVDGIKVFDGTNSNNYIQINSNGMKVYQGTALTSYKAADFGSDIKLYNNGYLRVQLDNDGLSIYDREGTNVVANFGKLQDTNNYTAIIGRIDGYCIHLTAFGGMYFRTSNRILGHLSVDGLQWYTNETTPQLMAHIGYGTTNLESGTGDNPYFTFGNRSTNSSIGAFSMAFGNDVEASAAYSVATGYKTIASGKFSHTEGWSAYFNVDGVSTFMPVTASGNASHAEGMGTVASGEGAHAEGGFTIASNINSHAEGRFTTASGYESHAEGEKTIASGSGSHAQNYYTVATESNQTVIGRYNKATVSGSGTNASPYIYTNVGNYAFIIGNGTANTTAGRSNALTVDWSGNVDIASGAKYKINGTALSAADVSAIALSDKYTRSSAGGLDWSNQTDGDAKIIAKSALAFWNGSYDGSTSNLTRFKASNGTSYSFGTLASKNSLSAADVGAVPKSVCCFANSVVRTPSSGTITFTLSELGITNRQKPVGILMTYQDGGATPTILRYDYDASSASSVIVKVYDVNGNAVSSAVRFFMMVFQGSWTSA